MDFSTLILALFLGFLGSFFLGGLLNYPDAGATIAIAFVGSRIVYLLLKENSKNDNDKEK